MKKEIITPKTQYQKLSMSSQYMAIFTLFIAVLMFFVNIICWIFPDFGLNKLGFVFSISMAENLNVDIGQMPGWQLIGGIIISSLPLIALSLVAAKLFHLFRLYSKKQYFTLEASNYLGGAGKYIIIGVILQFLSEPLLSYWMTMNLGAGKRFITLGFGSSELITLFIGTCFWIISGVLAEASKIYRENQSFI